MVTGVSVPILPAFFSDGMVIGKKAKIWGWASPGHPVEADFLDKKYQTYADSTGYFSFVITAEEFGGPSVLTIDEKVISDVYVGRLWLCGGQSNMETPLGRIHESAFFKRKKG
jgi:sialate O-acetylesterase